MRTEFEKDRRIDPESLDVEVTKQVDLFMKWAERSIDADALVDDLKLALEAKQAELDLRIRKKPHRFGFERDSKPTEAAVKATVLNHPEYQEARRRFNKARDTAAYLSLAIRAMEMKKKMLENLIGLHGMQYFAGPKTPRDLGKKWLEYQKTGEARLSQKMVVRIRSKRED